MSESEDTRLLTSYLAPERARVGGLAGLLVVAMLLPVAGPVLIGRFIDEALAGASTAALVALAVAYLAIVLSADALQLIVTWLSVRLAWRVGNRLRFDLARHALRLDFSWHGEHSPGLLIERIDGDVDALTKFSSTAILQLAGNAVLLVGVFVVSIAIDWRAGLLIGLAAAAAGATMVKLRSLAVPAHDHEREVVGRLYGDLEERLGGLEDLRANGAGRYALHRLHEHSARWWSAARHASLLGEGSYVAAAIAFSVGSTMTLGLGVFLHRQGELSVGSVLVLFRFAQMIREPLERIAEQMREFQKAVAGARRASRLLATPIGIADGPGRALPDGALSVDLTDVTLAYQTGGPVLHQLNLHLDPGCVLGVVGRTGSGKTSLGRLLLRFWDVTEGSVELGSVDVRDTTAAELRRRVGVVTQEVEIFRASVRDNLTLFGTVEADDRALLLVIDDVGLRPWLDGLSAGLESPLEGTGHLSAGEAQLLAFARVFLADPGLVVLDEASSRLDPDTEAYITAATDRLLADRTVVVIAHRLASLARADRILVLDHGRIAELGDREALTTDPDSRYGRLLAASAASGPAAAGDDVVAVATAAAPDRIAG